MRISPFFTGAIHTERSAEVVSPQSLYVTVVACSRLVIDVDSSSGVFCIISMGTSMSVTKLVGVVCVQAPPINMFINRQSHFKNRCFCGCVGYLYIFTAKDLGSGPTYDQWRFSPVAKLLHSTIKPQR